MTNNKNQETKLIPTIFPALLIFSSFVVYKVFENTLEAIYILLMALTILILIGLSKLEKWINVEEQKQK